MLTTSTSRTCAKVHTQKSPWLGIIKLNEIKLLPGRESLVTCDIPAGEGETTYPFLQCIGEGGIL